MATGAIAWVASGGNGAAPGAPASENGDAAGASLAADPVGLLPTAAELDALGWPDAAEGDVVPASSAENQVQAAWEAGGTGPDACAFAWSELPVASSSYATAGPIAVRRARDGDSTLLVSSREFGSADDADAYLSDARTLATRCPGYGIDYGDGARSATLERDDASVEMADAVLRTERWTDGRHSALRLREGSRVATIAVFEPDARPLTGVDDGRSVPGGPDATDRVVALEPAVRAALSRAHPADAQQPGAQPADGQPADGQKEEENAPPGTAASTSTTWQLGPSLSWAGELGFHSASADTPTPDPVADAAQPSEPASADPAVSAALAALPDDRLADIDARIAPGRWALDTPHSATRQDSTLAMEFASWIIPRADRTQLDRLQRAVPHLQPEIDAALHWSDEPIDAGRMPTMDSISQGAADDCWLLAGVGAVAIAQPERFDRILRANDNGSYSVLLSDARGGDPVWTSVTASFARTASGQLGYAFGTSRAEPTWTSVIEKARAAQPGYGSYASLSGGSMLSDPAKTAAGGIAAIAGSAATGRRSDSVTLAELAATVTSATPVTATTFLPSLRPASDDDSVRIVDRHVYVLESVDGDRIVLRNPWGVTAEASAPARIEIGLADLHERFIVVSFGTPAPPGP